MEPLVDNAVRYNESAGWLQVTTGTHAGVAFVWVANTGAVVPEAEVGRLFEPFQRSGTERTDRGDGWGLGLSIVKAIASAHGADVAARARPDGGLEVWVRFPVAEGAVGSARPTEAETPVAD